MAPPVWVNLAPVENLTTRTLPSGDLTPARVYAALRAKTPWRTSYLIEANAPDERGEQRSWIGFLVKNEAAFSPSADGVRELAAIVTELAAAPVDEASKAGGATDVLVLLMRDATLPRHGVAPRPEQAFVGRQLSDMASIAFDHVARTITLSSANANTVERLALALAAAPPLPDLPAAGGSRPEHVSELPPHTVFSKQLGRTERRLSLGGIEKLTLARSFVAPPRGADMFEVYRALRESAPARQHFFIELAGSPMFGAYTVAGAASASVHLSASAGADAFADEVFALLSTETMAGVPEKEALAVWRDVATLPFGMKGGAVVRASPGGAVELLRASAFVALEDGQLSTTGVAEVVKGRTVEAHTEAAAEDAAPALAAIRRAHDIAALREPPPPAPEPTPSA